jgi:hypothetical protein
MGIALAAPIFYSKDMIGILGLLKERGLNLEGKIKFVRHQDQKRFDVNALMRANQLQIYQAYQSKPIFKNCSYIVVFIGQENSKAIFFGVYEVLRERPASEVPLSRKFIYFESYSALLGQSSKFYDLQEIEGFDDLKNRVVIDWGKGALAWHQWAKEFEVTEILPQGYVREFPGFLDFVIRYDELTTIINAPEANREWHIMLSSVAGIYLILDTRNGMQYVGSAYGKNGILGRWKDYAKNGHGGNKLLKKLLDKDPDASKYFQYTILATLPKTLTNAEVISYENQYKAKLGTRAFGLNSSEGGKMVEVSTSEIYEGIVTPYNYADYVKKTFDLRKEFEEGAHIRVHPTGIKRVGHDRILCASEGYLVGEGFVFDDPEGFFFWDTSWNQYDGSGYTSHFPGHWIQGKILGPFWDLDLGVYWTVKDREEVLVRGSSLDEDYQAYRAWIEKVKDDPKLNRERAYKVAKEFVERSKEEEERQKRNRQTP